MTFQKTKYGRLPTPWGDLLVWCNGHDRETGYTVGFPTEWAHNRDRGTGPEGGGTARPRPSRSTGWSTAPTPSPPSPTTAP
jgi:hypothetical protein